MMSHLPVLFLVTLFVSSIKADPVSYELTSDRTIFPFDGRANMTASRTMRDTFHVWNVGDRMQNMTTITKSGEVLSSIDICDGAPAELYNHCSNIYYGRRGIYQSFSGSSVIWASPFVVAEFDPLTGVFGKYCSQLDSPLPFVEWPIASVAFDEARDQFAWMVRVRDSRSQAQFTNITLWSFSTSSLLDIYVDTPSHELVGILYLPNVDNYVVIDAEIRALYFYSVTNNRLRFVKSVSLASRLTEIYAGAADAHGTIVLTSAMGVCLYYAETDALDCIDSSPVKPAQGYLGGIAFGADGDLTVAAGISFNLTMNLLHYRPVPVPSQSSSSSSSSEPVPRPSSSTAAWESSSEPIVSSSSPSISSTGSTQEVSTSESLSAGSVAGIVIGVLASMALGAAVTAAIMHRRMAKLTRHDSLELLSS